MAITAAQVEANGWVLRLTLTGGLSSATIGGFTTAYATPGNAPDVASQWATNFSAYDARLTTWQRTWTATSPLTLTATGTGYAQSAGTAIAATPARTLYGTKILRKVVDATAAGLRRPKEPDEVDNGDGTITVRIALHQAVYAGDSGLSLAALAGWRSGMGAQTIAVANNSVVPAPAPIVRWSDVPYQRQTGPFRLEVVVASHHPNALAPVAAVRFTVTDGTTVKSFWATALSASPLYTATPGSGGGTGVAPRVYGVTVDPSGLTQGLLRCDFEAYPWIGPVQKSDAAGTRSMTGLGTAGLSTGAFVPFVVAYDPAGTWITPRFVDVDEVNGTATAASVTVGATAAAAAAGTPANSVNVAVQAMYLANVTVAAANGQAAIARSIDGLTITIRKANGATGGTGIVNGPGSTAVTAGAATGATFVTVRGDPGDTTARGCIWRSPASAGVTGKISKLRVTGLSVEAQTNACFVKTAGMTWLDNVEVRAVSGQTATTGLPFGATGELLWATNGKYWQHGTKLGSSPSAMPVLVRGMSVERDLSAPVVLGCARLASAVAGTPGFTTNLSGVADAGWGLERIAVGNDLRYLNGAPMGINSVQLAAANVPAAYTLGSTAYPAIARTACINNVGEAYGASQTMWASVGENTLVDFAEVVVEGNTLTGDRTNCPYGSGADVTIALTDTVTPRLRTFRFANNVTMKNASKHDRYNDGSILAGQPTGIAGSAGVTKKTWGRQGATLGAAATRSWAVAVGDELVIAGSPANVYHCTTAGTTAASGGPTGTGTAIADGTAVWQWVGTENRQHGFRPSSTGMWASHYGVGYEGNIDFQGPAGPSWDPEFQFEFYGIGSQQLSQDLIDIAATPFANDLSGTTNRLAFQAAGVGGGSYRVLATGSGSYALARGRAANVDTDQAGVARAASFAAGAVEAGGAVLVAPASARQGSRAAAATAGWGATCAAAPGQLTSRAGVTVAQWSVALAPFSATLATAAAAAVPRWTVGLAPSPARQPSLAGAGAAAWAGALTPAAAAVAQAASAAAVGWVSGLAVAPGRLATTAAATTAAPWLALTPDGGRIAVVDRTALPAAPPPASPAAPPDRTLAVSGGGRTLFVA